MSHVGPINQILSLRIDLENGETHMKCKLAAARTALLSLGACLDTGNTEGTLRGATGEDPALANTSMCSDGALREDCRNSPLGF